MKQRGRKGTEQTAVVRLASARRTLNAPAGMPAKAQEIFANTVASCAANHFRASDLSLLEQFCVAAHLASFYAARIGETDGTLKAWIEATKLMVSLATKLRLAPSARSDPKTVARYEPPPTSPPWDDVIG